MKLSKKEVLISILFPKHCPFCGRPMESQQIYCEECKHQLPWTCAAKLCPQCGQEHCICGDAPFLKRLYVPFFYKGLAAGAVKSLKFYNKRAYSRSLGCLLAQCIQQQNQAFHFDCIVPIPMTKKDIRKRGYSQAELIARFMGEALGIAVEKNNLIKICQTKKQHDLTATERKQNLKNAFSVKKPETLRGKSILLCDDVTTTGATLREASVTLQKAGVKEISAAVIATTEELENHHRSVYNKK